MNSDYYPLFRLQNQHYYSSRSLLRFTTKIENRGWNDFRPSEPRSGWDYHRCHGHYHSMEIFTSYDLLSMNNIDRCYARDDEVGLRWPKRLVDAFSVWRLSYLLLTACVYSLKTGRRRLGRSFMPSSSRNNREESVLCLFQKTLFFSMLSSTFMCRVTSLTQ